MVLKLEDDFKIKKCRMCILTTKNATIITCTCPTGDETIAKSSGGRKVKNKKDEGSAYAATQAAEEVAAKALSMGFNVCDFDIRGRGGQKRMGYGQGGQAAVRAIMSSGFRVGRIRQTTPIPCDGTRKKGGHRGRRV